MSLEISLLSVALITVVVLFGGLVTGITGFGYALVSTTTLAMLFDPQSAVVLMIIPALVANVPLLRELSHEKLKHCIRHLWAFIVAATIGTLVGMVLFRRIPTDGLTLALGVITLGYVAVSQNALSVQRQHPFHESELDPRIHAFSRLGIGLGGGLVFGASNIGIPLVAYLDSLDLERATFVGVVALIFLGVSTARVGTAWGLGLYGAGPLLWLSLGASIAGVIGVVSGEHVRHLLPDRYVGIGVQLLLVIIGLRLTFSGVGSL